MNIFIDLEMQNMRNATAEIRKVCCREVIEIGAVAVDDCGKQYGSFKTYVKPQYSDRISGKIRDLTGVSSGNVAGAECFEKAFHEMMQWCLSFENSVVYAWSESDLTQLTKEGTLKHVEVSAEEQAVLDNWRDLQKEFDELIDAPQATSLGKAVSICGLEDVGRKHDAYWDDVNTAAVFETIQDREGFLKSLDRIRQVLGYEEEPITLGRMIDFSAFSLSA